jgi:hypothetical protein
MVVEVNICNRIPHAGDDEDVTNQRGALLINIHCGGRRHTVCLNFPATAVSSSPSRKQVLWLGLVSHRRTRFGQAK